MWARRCGAKKHWPSRIRVVINSFINGLVGIAIFKYLTAADVGYLDLSKPTNEEILCLTTWPLRYETLTWPHNDVWLHWKNALFDSRLHVQQNRCPREQIPPEELQGTCDSTSIPVQALQRTLGYAFGAGANWNTNVADAYGAVFAYIGLCIFITTTVHDVALLTVKHNSYILDVQGVKRNFPTFVHMGYVAAGFPCIKWLANRHKAGRIVAFALIPLVVAWSVFVLAFVWYPVGSVLFYWSPVRLSRLAVFVNTLLLCIYGVAVIIHSLVWLGEENWRPVYAITWEAEAGGCICGCVFHAAQGSILQVLFIGLSVTFKAFMFAFRCLKGLRRTNWASLLTVMFPVPLAVYPVRWTQPDGSPIMHRAEDEPVQGELAFDPFALMDEQPESAHTTLKLMPEPMNEEDRKHEPELAAPASRTVVHIGPEIVEHIGCCGFPYLAARPRTPNPGASAAIPEDEENE